MASLHKWEVTAVHLKFCLFLMKLNSLSPHGFKERNEWISWLHLGFFSQATSKTYTLWASSVKMSRVLSFKATLVFGKILGPSRESAHDHFVSLMRVSPRGRPACQGGKMGGWSTLNLRLLTASAFDAVSGEHTDRLLSVNKLCVFSAVPKGESRCRRFALTSLFLFEV